MSPGKRGKAGNLEPQEMPAWLGLRLHFFAANAMVSPRRTVVMNCGRFCLFLVVAILVAGCETAEQERLRHFHDDGVVRFRQGDFQGARDSFSAGLNLKPEDPNILFNIGQCYDRQGDWTNAEKYYRDALAKSDNHEDSRHALEVILYRTGRRPEAARMIQDWLARQPDLP